MGIGSEFEERGVNIPLQIPERRAGKQMPLGRRWEFSILTQWTPILQPGEGPTVLPDSIWRAQVPGGQASWCPGPVWLLYLPPFMSVPWGPEAVT